MTNEEIKEIYERNTSRVVMEESAQSLHDYDAIDEAILEFGRLVALQAYEKAAQAQCRYCRQGILAVAVMGSVVDGLIPLGETAYLHRADGRYLHADMPCESRNIRMLKDSLVQETVPSGN